MKIFGLNDRLFEVEDSTTSIAADLSDLEDNTDEVETPEETEVESLEETEESEESEEESEESEESEEIEDKTPKEELEVSHPFDRPSIKQLNETFPDLFKKFPSLKDMYFREAEFTKIFPTIDDAKEAFENHSAFSNIREDIFNGDGSKFLSAIKEVNDKGLEKFARNFLPNLVKTHAPAFWQAANPLIEDVARSMYNKGVQENNESMQNAARYLSKFFFGDTEVAEGKKTTVVKEEKSEVSDERKAWDQERHNAFRGSVETDVKSKLIDLITGKDPKTGKSRIDPDDVLSSFIRSTIVDYIISDIGKQLTADKAHIRYMDSLWDHAKKNGRTDADKARIISAYLARAKALIPSLRSKYVSEALGKRVRDSGQRKEKVSSMRERGSSMGRGSNGSNKNYSSKTIDYSKTSDEDILNDNITFK